ncbi:hypothetical protein LguiB_021307 [Lonicera macranthoides]
MTFEIDKWLNLSLGTNQSSTPGDSDSQPRPESEFTSKAFHQNAHKRERVAVKRYQSQRMMNMMGFPINTTAVRSLGVRPHSLVHKLGREGGAIVARFNEANTGFAAWGLYDLEEAMDMMWPGSFYLDQQPQVEQSD